MNVGQVISIYYKEGTYHSHGDSMQITSRMDEYYKKLLSLLPSHV
jgi:hypothetical protein